MAENSTKIVLTAEDRASAVLSGVTGKLQGLRTTADLAGQALGAIGVNLTAAAMVAMVKGTIDAADGFNDLSQRIGINIRDLAGWSLAATQSGTSMEAVAKGVKTLSGYMIEHRDKLREAGITATDANGALIQLADIFKALPDGIIKTELATKLFGKAGMELIPMLNQGSAGLAEAKAKADEYGRRIAEIAPDADKFNDQLAEMALQSKGLGISIAQYFLPGLIGLSQWLIDVKNNGREAFDAVEWMFGERAARAAALAGLGGSGAKREASGRIGGQTAAGMTPAEEDALAERNLAGMKAMGIIGPQEKPGTAPKYRRDFDPAADFQFAIDEAQRKAAKQRSIDAEKEMEALDAKAKAMDEAHMKRMEEQRLAMEGEEAIREHLEKTSRAMEKQADVARELGMSFSSAFEDAILGGKGFSNVLRGLATDIARIAVRKSITEPMGEAVSGFLKDAGVGSIFKDIAGSFFGGARAGGGPVDAGRAYLVGERGPELFLPGASGSIVPNAAMGGGMTVNIIEDSSRAGRVQQRNEGGQSMLDVFVAQIRSVVAGDIASGRGPIPAAMESTYGANRAAGAY